MKPAEIELAQLKTAVFYLAELLEEGSLVQRFDTATRLEVALTLEFLLDKVAGLPQNVPPNLVQAAAVRALIAANDKLKPGAEIALAADLAHHQHEAQAAASLHGHTLGSWQQLSGSDLEYEAVCQLCGSVVYVSHTSIYSLLPENCVQV